MPIYEYECKNMNCENFEKVVEILYFPGDKDPKCKKCDMYLKKGMSTTNFVVNGHNVLNGYSKKQTMADGPAWKK